MKMIKKALYPLRRLAGRFIIKDTAEKAFKPIDLAANYVCAEDVPGDYLEFGVFRGSSFIEAYHKIEAGIKDWSSSKRAQMAYSDRRRAEDFFKNVTAKTMRYFAFDSFDGLPEPMGIDRGHPKFSKGRYDCSERDFRRILRDNGVSEKKVVVVPGFYDRTLTADTKKRAGLKNASIVMVDCDLYESARLVLDFITDLIGDGTIIIFDDWFNFKGNPELGEQRACREWLAKNEGISLTPYARWGMSQASFVVHKKG